MKLKIVAAVMLLALSGCGMHTVDTGHRGIKVSFGKVEGEPLVEDLYFVNPFTTTIEQMDIRTQRWDGKEGSQTKDTQDAIVAFAVNYSLRADTVGVTYKTVGEDWANKLVAPVIMNDLKDEIAKWDAVDLVANRQSATDHVTTAIRKDLHERGVTIEGFYITDITFSPGFAQSIERKVIAAQDALAAQNRTEQIRQQAAQKVISAQAEAQSMQIRGDALVKNPKLVDWEAVQRWDGHLPQYNMGGATPFIQMPSAESRK
jgi:prohibitin 2